MRPDWDVCQNIFIDDALFIGYAINFFLCEILALFNVIGMIYFTDRFLGHQFTTVREH